MMVVVVPATVRLACWLLCVGVYVCVWCVCKCAGVCAGVLCVGVYVCGVCMCVQVCVHVCVCVTMTT